MSIRVDEAVTQQTVTVDGVSGSYRQVVLLIPEAKAEALAAAPRTSGGDLYASDSKEVARATSDALVAAGMGGS